MEICQRRTFVKEVKSLRLSIRYFDTGITPGIAATLFFERYQEDFLLYERVLAPQPKDTQTRPTRCMSRKCIVGLREKTTSNTSMAAKHRLLVSHKVI